MENIREKIYGLADEKYKQFHSSLCPGVNNLVGVRVPVLRKYAKELVGKYNLKEILRNLQGDYYEEILLEGMLIGMAQIDVEQRIQYIKKFVPKIDNWAICDTTCAGLKFTKSNREIVWELIQKYLKSDKEFEQRFAVVMMIDFYITEDYIDLVLKGLEQVNNEAYYVKMAVAWAVSICFIKFPKKTQMLLESNKLDHFTHNKSIQKIIESYRVDKEIKKELRKLKRDSFN